jgi:hypothetical protein
VTYAAGTTVPVTKSEAELKALLRKHGAERLMTAHDDSSGQAFVAFELGGRQMKLEVTVPTLDSYAENANVDPPRGWKGWTPGQRKEWCRKQQETVERERWRLLVLCTKAKLELIATGMTTLEKEFLANIMLAGGRTLYQQLAPGLNELYLSGKVPPLLPGKK